MAYEDYYAAEKQAAEEARKQRIAARVANLQLTLQVFFASVLNFLPFLSVDAIH